MDKLHSAIEALYSSLTTIWEDNGNIMADAVRDNVFSTISELTNESFKEIEVKVKKMVDAAQ